MNWKQVASMSLAAAIAAAISVLSKQEPIVQAGLSGVFAGIIHKINVWGAVGK